MNIIYQEREFDMLKVLGNWPDPEYDVSNWQSADEIEPSSFGELEPTLVS